MNEREPQVGDLVIAQQSTVAVGVIKSFRLEHNRPLAMIHWSHPHRLRQGRDGWNKNPIPNLPSVYKIFGHYDEDTGEVEIIG